MFLIGGIVFSHEAVRDWEIKLAPGLAESLQRRRRGKAGCSWCVDETYIKVHSQWRYLYRAIDRLGALVDVMFSEHRDMAAAKAFSESAKMVTGVTPDRVTTDGHDRYSRAIRTVLGKVYGIATASISITDWSKITAVLKAATVRCDGFKCPHDELRNFLRSRSRTNQQVSTDYRRFHFLRRTATVLPVLEAV
jgi:putative transposase